MIHSLMAGFRDSVGELGESIARQIDEPRVVKAMARTRIIFMWDFNHLPVEVLSEIVGF